MGKQAELAIQASGISGRSATAGHNPVAGHDEADRVGTNCASDCPRGSGNTNAAGYLAIGYGGPGGNPANMAPDTDLKGGSRQ